MSVLRFCVYKHSNVWCVLIYVCAFNGFGWSYPLLESERPSSFRSVSVIVAVGLFASRLCCYRAKQPISLLPTLRTSNHFSSPTASLLLRANHVTHVPFISTIPSLCFKVSPFRNVNLAWEIENIFWIIRFELHPPPFSAQWDWNGHLDSGISITALVHAGIAFPKIQHRVVWQFMLYSSLSLILSTALDAVLCQRWS